MTIESGNPHGDRDLSNLHNYPGVVLLQRTAFSLMTSRRSGSPIGGEGNSQTTHGSIVVECFSSHNRKFIRIMGVWRVLGYH